MVGVWWVVGGGGELDFWPDPHCVNGNKREHTIYIYICIYTYIHIYLYVYMYKTVVQYDVQKMLYQKCCAVKCCKRNIVLQNAVHEMMYRKCCTVNVLQENALQTNVVLTNVVTI